MANKDLFSKLKGYFLPKANTVNSAGGTAYSLEDKAALAQLAATGCLSTTFYVSAAEQLAQTLALAAKVDPEFVAKTAIYSRQRGYMKDMPVLLLAHLSKRSPELLTRAFPQVVDSARTLRSFVQIVRSGAAGRRSLGTVPKRLVRQWLQERSDEDLFAAAVGSSPSLADIVKMVHPKPENAGRQAFYAYLLGREHVATDLPQTIRDYEAFKADRSQPLPEVSFQYLTALELGRADWLKIAERASWTMTRMNLNTFARHGVFEVPGMTEKIASRLRNPELIRKAKVFPYQLLAAYLAAQELPRKIKEALREAMEVAIGNVPKIEGRVYVLTDVSGSMHSSVTGSRPGATSAVRCIDVAGLMTAAILRRNPEAKVLPFSDDVVEFQAKKSDNVMETAKKLSNLPARGTNCSAPLRRLNELGAQGELVIYVSDNESWIDTGYHGRYGGSATETLKQWQIFKSRNPRAKLICIDIQPSTTTQAKERQDIFNVGGFSDEVFRFIASVAEGREGGWVREIEKMVI